MLSKPPPQPFAPGRKRRRRARQRLFFLACAVMVGLAAWWAGSEVSAPEGVLVLAQRSGRGSVLARGGGERAWARDVPLGSGDVLDLEQDGEAVVVLGNSLRVFLAPSTRMVLGDIRRRRWGGEYRADLELARGRAWVAVRGNAAVTLSSPMGRVRLGQGAAVEIRCDSGAMRVMAWRGEATCLSHATRTAEYLLAEGQVLVSQGLNGEQRIESLRRTKPDPFQVAWLAQSL